MGAPPDQVDQGIVDALRRVCALLDLDLAVLWQWSASDPDIIRPTHVYRAQGGPPASEPLRQEQYPWYREQMLAGHVVRFVSPDELPADAAVDRDSARRHGISSSLCLPLSVGGESPVGALAFNTVRAERDWPDVLIQRLRLVAQVFTNALARRRHEQALQESEARLSAGAELAGLAFYEVDFNHRVMYVDDRFREICGTPPELTEGLEPLEWWMEQQNGWTYGALANHIWSFAGESDRAAVNATFLQPFASFTTKKATTLTLNTESTYDWDNVQWTVPVNLMVQQLVKIGSQPVAFVAGGRYNAEKPAEGPDWGLRLAVIFLFPMK